MKRCRKPERKHISTTIDQDIYDRLVPTIEKEWGGPFSTWLDYIATCWLQDNCNGCVYAKREGQKKSELVRLSRSGYGLSFSRDSFDCQKR